MEKQTNWQTRIKEIAHAIVDIMPLTIDKLFLGGHIDFDRAMVMLSDRYELMWDDDKKDFKNIVRMLGNMDENPNVKLGLMLCKQKFPFCFTIFAMRRRKIYHWFCKHTDMFPESKNTDV